MHIEVPGAGTLALEHLMLDVNCTIAHDGAVLPVVASDVVVGGVGALFGLLQRPDRLVATLRR